MIAIEIYWQDLTEEKQNEIIERLGIDPDDHNWDIFPMTTIDINEDSGGNEESGYE